MKKCLNAGIIKPVGFLNLGIKRTAQFKVSDIKKIEKYLGITLKSTSGLLTEKEFKTKFKLSKFLTYKKKGFIKPVGYASVGPSICAFYNPNQIHDLKKKIGVTLKSTKVLISEENLAKLTNIPKHRIQKYKKMKIIKPVGFDLVGARLTPFYSKGAIKLIKNKTGNLLTDTKGLISEFQFGIMSGLSRIARYRKKGIVKPVGHAITNAKDVTAFYSLKQVNEFKKSLGVTLKSTKGLLVEKKFIEVSGFSEIAKYRKKGLIKPTGFALTSGGLSAFYHPRQIKELKQKLGITLTDTKGLISERRARDIAGLRKIKEHREKGLIKPYGTGMSNSGISKFYHPKQLKKLLKNLKENKSKNNRNS